MRSSPKPNRSSLRSGSKNTLKKEDEVSDVVISPTFLIAGAPTATLLTRVRRWHRDREEAPDEGAQEVAGVGEVGAVRTTRARSV